MLLAYRVDPSFFAVDGPWVHITADSGHRDQPIRLIVITQTGDRDHAAHLGRGVPGAQHGVALVVTTDGCSLSHSFVVFVKHVNPAQ